MAVKGSKIGHGDLTTPREEKQANSGMFGDPVEGPGYGKFGKSKHPRQRSIDSGVRRKSKKPGRTTATQRGDTFKNKSGWGGEYGKFSFGKI